MKIPLTVPYFKVVVGLIGLWAIVWLALEGRLVGDILLAAAVLLIALVYIIIRRWGGQTLPAGRAILLATAAGLAFGAGLALLTLFLMAFKTGLHAHGPEYTAQEIAWLWRQLPLWAGVGGLAGLGGGLLAAGRK
jgi:hypothetical protein